MTVVQNGAENGSKEAKSKKEKKELTQDKKLTAEESSDYHLEQEIVIVCLYYEFFCVSIDTSMVFLGISGSCI
jgi:5-formaminoimidazole-4-carboxamide-1-beta-D-ribofuranosyl 5'-monophosphate synthetase